MHHHHPTTTIALALRVLSTLPLPLPPHQQGQIDQPGGPPALALEQEAVDAALQAELVAREGVEAEAEEALAVAGRDEVAEEGRRGALGVVVVVLLVRIRVRVRVRVRVQAMGRRQREARFGERLWFEGRQGAWGLGLLSLRAFWVGE